MTMEEHSRAVMQAAGMALVEHFDAIQIVATRVDPDTGQTQLYAYGVGNEFARISAADEWVATCEANLRARRETAARENLGNQDG